VWWEVWATERQTPEGAGRRTAQDPGRSRVVALGFSQRDPVAPKAEFLSARPPAPVRHARRDAHGTNPASRPPSAAIPPHRRNPTRQ
jgi:hypothetical protein